jgi:aspartate racemase
MRRPAHIGIVACSAEGAALCYRTICAEAPVRLGPHAHPEISMHTPSLADYVRALDAGDLPAVAALMLDSATKLAAIGAEFLICPDNTIHAALPLAEPRSPRPWLHIAKVVAESAEVRGLRRLAVLGTRWLMESPVYPDALGARGLEWARPSATERAAVNRVIMDELVPARPSASGTATLLDVIARMKVEEACDGVVLACTELPLAVDDANSALPTLDSTRLLARAALRRALT